MITTRTRKSLLTIALIGFMFLLGFSALTAFAAPDITAPYLGVPSNIIPGQSVTFSGDVRNVGDGMDLTNSYGFVNVATGDDTGDIYDFSISGNYLFAVGYEASASYLIIYDISNILSPARVSRISLADAFIGTPTSITISGSYAYTDTGFSLKVIDISNPSNPSIVATKPGFGSRDVHAVGNFLYAGTDDSSTAENFRIFDISNPLNPVKIHASNWPVDFGSMRKSGNYLFAYVTQSARLVNGYFGLYVFDVSNPNSPQRVATLTVPNLGDNNNNGLEIFGQTLFLSSGQTDSNNQSQLYTINISDPTSPSVIGRTDLLGDRYGSLAVNGQYVFAGRSPYGFLNVVDVTNLANPFRRNLIAISSTLGIYDTRAIAFRDNRIIAGMRVSTPPNLYILEPHTFSRFCITNAIFSGTAQDACFNSTATGRIGTTDIDNGMLGGTPSLINSPSWSATVGPHTIYLCSDVRRVYSSPGYTFASDGVAESNESNNCTSATFNVASTPTVSTNAATAVTASSVTLNGSANPRYGDATGFFRWGTSNVSCSSLPNTVGSVALGSGNTSVSYSASLSGISGGTTYYYCAAASNYAGTGYGSVTSFTTPSAFNFSLANGGNKSVTQGGNVTNSITATLSAGTAQLVSFSASGLPAGASASFAPGSCNPTCTTTMTLNVGAGTVPGNYTVTVTGIGGSVTQTTQFTLTVNPQATVDLTVNGSNGPVSVTAPANLVMSWTTANSPTSCTATGNWSGAKAVSGGTQNLSGVGIGSYTYGIYCTSGGVNGPTDSVSVTVNNALPTASISSPTVGTHYRSGNSITFTGSGSDPDGGVVSAYEWRADPSSCGVGGTVIGSSASFGYSSLGVGSHTVQLRVQDNEGAWSSSCASVSFIVDPVITISQTGSGSVSPSGSVQVPYGSDQAFTITPAPDYYISNVFVDGSPIGAVTSYTFTNVDGNHTLSATFAQTSGQLNVSANSCFIPFGAYLCSVNADWWTTGATNAYVMEGNTNTTLYTANSSGPVPVSAAYPGTTFSLKNGGTNTTLSQQTVTASCTPGSTWSNAWGRCLQNVDVITFDTTDADDSIPWNTSTNLSWTVVGGGTVNCDVTANTAANFLGNFNGSGSVSTGNRIEDTTFTITCTNGVSSDVATVALDVQVGCPYSVADASGTTWTTLSDATVETSRKTINGTYYKVDKFTTQPGTPFCFRSTNNTQYYVPYKTWAEFSAFWSAIDATPLPGLVRILN